jgi:hypothetical protein
MYANMMNGHTVFLCKYLWKIKVPLKIKIFMWFLSLLGKPLLPAHQRPPVVSMYYLYYRQVRQRYVYYCQRTKPGVPTTKLYHRRASSMHWQYYFENLFSILSCVLHIIWSSTIDIYTDTIHMQYEKTHIAKSHFGINIQIAKSRFEIMIHTMLQHRTK